MAYFDDVTALAGLMAPWGKLTNKNILITGATGLIGSCLVDILMNHVGQDYNVYASGRNLERVKQHFVRYINSDRFHLVRYDVTEPLCSDVDFHFIIDAASGASPVMYSTDPVGVMKCNLWGVDNLLQYGLKHHLEKFVYVSSGDVYGEGKGDSFMESDGGYIDNMNLRSCYSNAKKAAETLCVSYSHQYGIDVSIARPCHTYGPYFTESDSRVYAQFLRNGINNEDIVLKSDGMQYRSWCYVVDCAAGILFVALKGGDCQAYNIAGHESTITIRGLAEMIASHYGRSVVFDNPSDIEKPVFGVASHTVLNTNKLEALGWAPMFSIQRGMASTMEELDLSHK